MSLPGLPYRIMDLLSDPLVLLDGKGAILYANPAYQISFPLKDADREDISRRMRNLIMKFQRSGKSFASEITRITVAGREFYANILALDDLGAEQDVNLVLFKTSGHEQMSETGDFEDFLKASLDEQEILHKKLSPEFDGLVGKDAKFRNSLYAAQKAAGTDLPVLITGESGTGKEKLAQIIHRISRRRENQFVDINCAAIPDNLIESELFGYETGAFTGARQKGKKGLFEEAHNGSIFLDEIGDTSPPAQSKLLRVLEEGLYKRVGGTKKRPCQRKSYFRHQQGSGGNDS